MNRFNVSVRKIGKKFGKETTRRAQNRNQSAAFVGFGDEWDQLVSSSPSIHPEFTIIHPKFTQISPQPHSYPIFFRKSPMLNLENPLE